MINNQNATVQTRCSDLWGNGLGVAGGDPAVRPCHPGLVLPDGGPVLAGQLRNSASDAIPRPASGPVMC